MTALGNPSGVVEALTSRMPSQAVTPLTEQDVANRGIPTRLILGDFGAFPKN